MRLFTAINFTPEIKTSLLDCISKMKAASSKGNFTSENNLHLTINFIGETNRAMNVKEVMSGINIAPFTLTLGKTGVFRRTGGDIYWIGAEKNAELDNLHKLLSESLRSKGFSLENRDYMPHITLGREVVLKTTPNFDVPKMSMTVSRISLMNSERINGKLIYTEIFAKQL
jgi:2'-5' RNA ligase